MSTMTNRMAGISAALFAILLFVGTSFAFDSPDTDASDQEWLDYVQDSNKLVMNIVGAYMMVIAGILFLVFLAMMYRRMRAAEGGDGLLSLIMMVTGIGWAVALMVGTTLIVAVPGSIKFGGAPDPTAETARWLGQVGFGVILVAGGLCAAAWAAAISTLILQTKTLPAWLGYLGYIAAIAMVAAAIFLPVIIFVLWILVLGIVLMVRGDSGPAMAAS